MQNPQVNLILQPFVCVHDDATLLQLTITTDCFYRFPCSRSLNCANLQKNTYTHTHTHTQTYTKSRTEVFLHFLYQKKYLLSYTAHTKCTGGKLLWFLFLLLLGLAQLCRIWNINHKSTFLNWEHNAWSINVFFQPSFLITTNEQRLRKFIFSFMFLLFALK